MPTYIYRCDKCRARFETQQPITDAALATCGDLCPDGDGTGTVERVIQLTAFVLNGKGFFVNDYKRKE